VLQIDGSTGEGGGQILRMAVFCSLLTGKPFRLFKIRHYRYKPGITHQQLKLLELVQQMSTSGVERAWEGSNEISFYPGIVQSGTYAVTCQKPAALTLILQSVLPLSWLANGPVNLVLRGGTDFASSMTFDYTKGVLMPHLRGVKVKISQRDFYPGVMGEIHCEVKPDRKALPLNLTRIPIVRSISVHVIASVGLSGMLNSLASSAYGLEKLSFPVEYLLETYDTSQPGGAITLVAHCEAGDRIGAQGVVCNSDAAETVSRRACEDLLAEIHSGCAIDRYAADNLMPWLFLRGGTIRPFTLTKHLTTSVFVFQQFISSNLTIADGLIKVEKFTR
jgi:RNA 3'-phosphate cyclase